MKGFPKSILRISALMHTITYGTVAYFVIYRLIAEKNYLITYLLNILLIIIMLFCDDKAHRYAERKTTEIREVFAEMNIALKIFFVFSIGFVKTGMYIFYMIGLIISKIAELEPNLVPFGLGYFFKSIEYGLILLFVLDNLKELTKKDAQWLKKNVI